MIRVLIVDDHQIVGEGTKSMIELEEDMQAEYILNEQEALIKSGATPFDVYLLDMNMPNCSGIELAQKILHIQTDAKIILYTGFEYVSQFNLLINSGISGIISKSASQQELLMAIRAAVNGYTLLPISLLRQLRTDDITTQQIENKAALLTQKELEILESVSKGSSNKQIADELYMSSRAVEYNLTKIFKKLKVGSRSEALTEAMRQGILNVHV
ncbi:response regulator transcription factor [Bacillus tropicus]|uniref:response regulator n=1 Tax=Bacillus tropicus TaxID=2026188 RepID=UPI00240762FA|nr:response regulator transcription factor [Bacillus tropicus]MDF9554823.1 response regulator transcription factor [Bacillus tropicus]MDF9590883.1 response regulator transcription factor [Bacillus tropicus]MDF9648317.1 response regulator transcription factor [Bacillus tropicus]